MANNMTFVRRIDELGRIVIPKELCDREGDKGGDAFEIIPFGDGYILKRYNQRENHILRLDRLRTEMGSAYKNPPAGLIERMDEIITLLKAYNEDGV